MTAPGGAVVVFPGQGTQRPGMGEDFIRRSATARATFEEAGEAAGADIAAICLNGDPRLKLTEFAQPCILTVEIAAYRVAVEDFGLTAGLFGGHSLGEYAALVAAGVIPFAEAIRLVRLRGALMQAAVPPGAGAMAALILNGVKDSGALEIVDEAGAEVANDNSAAQVVISGTADSVERARRRLATALPALTFAPLPVSAPFHSSLMRPIEEEFRTRLMPGVRNWRTDLARAVTSNRTGGLHDPDTLPDDLVHQISSTVRWADDMRVLAGAGEVYEIGPKAPLGGFFRTIGTTTIPITTVAEAETGLRGRPPAGPRRPAPEARPGFGREETRAAEELGSAGFRRDHRTRLAYVAGGMRLGISSPALVIRLARAGLLGFLGTDGLELDEIDAAVRAVQAAVPAGSPWGVNLWSGRGGPVEEAALIDLLLERGVRQVEVAGYERPTRALVRYRLSGVRRDANGSVVPANRILAKVARPEIARSFLGPPPEAMVRALRDGGEIAEDEARLAGSIGLVDDLCAAADGGGHTDGTPALALLPAFLRLRDAASGAGGRVRVGLAGGIGTPHAAAAAFAMGAGFVVTGSINQCTSEAATSAIVKDLLAATGIQDFARAPAADRFETGGDVQVLRKGVFFPARAAGLRDLYRRHAGIEDLPSRVRAEVETRCLGAGFDEVWAGVRERRRERDPALVDRADGDPRLRMALVFRWYLERSERSARDGVVADRLNFQVHSGPALGALNEEVRGTPLEKWRDRHVDDLAWYLMVNAAALLGRAAGRPDSAVVPA